MQASKNQQDGEELIRKAQRYVRDTKAHAKKSAAAAESTAQQLADAQETLRQRCLACAPSHRIDAQHAVKVEYSSLVTSRAGDAQPSIYLDEVLAKAWDDEAMHATERRSWQPRQHVCRALRRRLALPSWKPLKLRQRSMR